MAYVSAKLETFLVQKKLYRCLSALYDIPEEKKSSISFAQKDGRLLSYIKPFEGYNNEEDPVYDESFRAKHAIEIKPARLMPKSMSLSDKQELSSALIARDKEVNAPSIYEVTKEISKWYMPNNYKRPEDGGNGGMLHGSCMRYSYCQKATKFYEKCPECFLFIKRDSYTGLLVARALLWYAYHVDSDKYVWFLDRIYAIDDNNRNTMRQKARELGFADREEVKGTFRVFYEPDLFDYPPYTDTMGYYSIKHKCLQNKNDEGSCRFTGHGNKEEHFASLARSELSKYSMPDKLCKCAACGNVGFIDSMLECSDNYYCKTCCTVDHRGKVYSINECVRVNGSVYHKSDKDIIFSSFMNRYYLKDECERISSVDSYMHKDDIVMSKKHNCKLYRHSAIEAEGDYYNPGDINKLIIFDEKSRKYRRKAVEEAVR